MSHVEQELMLLQQHPGFSGVRVAWTLTLRVVFCTLLFVVLSLFFWPVYCLSLFFWPVYCLSLFFWPVYCLSLFFWPVYCLSLFDLRLLVTTYVSWNLSYVKITSKCSFYLQDYSLWYPYSRTDVHWMLCSLLN